MPLKVNVDGITSRFSEHNIAKARYVAANQAMINMNKYVPYSGETGKQDHLRDADAKTPKKENNVEIAKDGSSITWRMPYATAQYFGFVNGHRVMQYTTPGTSRRWDLRMTGNNQDMLEVTNAFKNKLMKG